MRKTDWEYIDNPHVLCYTQIVSKEHFCPVCGELADSPHHAKPRSAGGTDEPRNIEWLCKHCHDYIEQIQEERGVELSPDLIDEMEHKLKIKLDTDSEGITDSYSYMGGKFFLQWKMLPGKTKQVINKFIDGIPDGYDEDGNCVSQNTQTQVRSLVTQRIRRSRGRPLNDKIDTTYLNELVFNKGLSLRQVVKQLGSEGFRVSHEFIRERIKIIPLDNQRKCKYKHCGKLYQPTRRNSAYCSPECDALDNRHSKRLITKGLLNVRSN